MERMPIMEDKRQAERYPPLPNVEAIFSTGTEDKQIMARSSHVLDISNRGCCFTSGDVVPLRQGMSGRLTLQAGFQNDEIENVKIKRKWSDGIALSFAPLELIDKYCLTDKKMRLEFAYKDYDLVHREIMDIKSCRTNIFVGTLGVIGAIGVAIIGILGTTLSTSWNNWLPFAATIPTLLLTCSILSTIHKAKGINVRAGYMEALSEYLAWGKVPEFFCGWARANRVGKRCEIFKKMGHKLDQGLKPTCKGDPNCSELAKEFTREYIKHIELKPYLLESFTSLSTHIYAGAYLISVVSVLTATMRALRNKISDFEPEMYWLLVTIGAVITFLLIIANVLFNKRGGGSKSGQPNIYRRFGGKFFDNLFKVYKHSAALVLPAFLIALILVKEGGFPKVISTIAVYGLGAVITAACISAGYSFYNKLYSLRRGHHSLARWRYIWRLRFAICPLMIQDTAPTAVNDI